MRGKGCISNDLNSYEEDSVLLTFFQCNETKTHIKIWVRWMLWISAISLGAIQIIRYHLIGSNQVKKNATTKKLISSIFHKSNKKSLYLSQNDEKSKLFCERVWKQLFLCI